MKLIEQDGWTNVARLSSLAEAGFLNDELVSEGFEARVYAAESFSAVSDRWNVSYLIQVPSGSAHDAAGVIRRRLAEDQYTEEELADYYSEPGAASWRPAALVLMAGAVCFVLGQQFARHQQSFMPLPANSLPATIGSIGRPLFTEPAAGAPRHRLSYEWRQQAWVLDTDSDGDGRFEARRQFDASGSSW